MKENLKNQKGITLIALIITIIVLLILTMVSIKLIWDGGIIAHSNNAVNAYDKAQINELEKMNIVEDYLTQFGQGGKTENNREELWNLIKSRAENPEYNDGFFIVGISGSDFSESGYIIGVGIFKDADNNVDNIQLYMTKENEYITYIMLMKDLSIDNANYLANQWYQVTSKPRKY